MQDWTMPLVELAGPRSKPKTPEQARQRTPLAVEQAILAAQRRFPAGSVSCVVLPGAKRAAYDIRLRQPGEVRKGDGNTRVVVHPLTLLRVTPFFSLCTGFAVWRRRKHLGANQSGK